MFTFFRIVLLPLIIFSPLPLMAGTPKVKIAKKPERFQETYIALNKELTAADRLKWKSILNWCDECDERSKTYLERFGTRDQLNGGIFIYPISDNQYIVDVNCSMTMRQSEHIYYKITEHFNTIESRLLILEQFDYIPAEGEIGSGIEEPTEDPKGEFIRLYDSLIYGLTVIPGHNQKQLIVEREYRGVGGCGLYTVYDVSGDCPKVVDFRARPYCSANIVPPEKWKSYPPEERAKWRVVPNPLRKNWKSSSTPACME